MIPEYWEHAKRELAKRDCVMERLIERHPGISLSSRQDPFLTLARSIVGQQISVKAAESVWQRLCAHLGRIEPEIVAAAALEELKLCGLSMRKAEYLKDLASRFLDSRLQPEKWPGLDDEQLISELCQIRGIGRWSAEMFLIFHLMRPDVLPLDDIGLQRAIRINYSDAAMAKAQMRDLARSWQPWRSVATWYLWRSLDPVPVEY